MCPVKIGIAVLKVRVIAKDRNVNGCFFRKISSEPPNILLSNPLQWSPVCTNAQGTDKRIKRQPVSTNAQGTDKRIKRQPLNTNAQGTNKRIKRQPLSTTAQGTDKRTKRQPVSTNAQGTYKCIKRQPVGLPAPARPLPCLHRLQEGLRQGLACSFVGNHEEVQHQHKLYPSNQKPL